MPILDKKIYFLGDTAEIISDILKKYELEETDEELAKKIFGEEPFIIRGGVILKYAISLAKKEITEKEISASLVKELGISQIIAESLTSEIKNKLVSIATTEKPIQQKSIMDESIINIKPPIGIPSIGEIIDFKNNIEKPRIEKYKKNTTKKVPMTQEKEEQQKKSDDAYREVI